MNATLDKRNQLARRRQPWALALVAVLLAFAVVAAIYLGTRALELIPANPVPSPSPSSLSVPRLVDAAMAYDGGHKQVVLFGTSYAPDGVPAGVKQGLPVAETWTRESGKWKKLAPAASPSPRRFAGMAYDAARRQVVLLGGWSITDGAPIRDTWTWDGKTWTQRTTKVSPPACNGQILVYDSRLTRVVAVVDACIGTETWTWDGNAWARLNPTVELPGPRFGSAAAYDATNGTIVVFSQQSDGITWTFDGKTWLRKAVAAGDPPGRDGASMAFDPSSGKVVMFGGSFSRGTTYLGDTWLWDGTAWTQAHPALSPAARDRAIAITDTGTGQVILYGGFTSGLITYSDVWIWAQGSWILVQPTTSPARV